MSEMTLADLERGVPVFNTPGANANAVKELVLAGLFIASRNLIPAARFAHTLQGDDAAITAAVEAGKKRFVGFELPGRTLGIIGLGAIGVQVANAALGLGLRVVGYDPAISVEHAWLLSSEVERAQSIDEVFRRADILTVEGREREMTPTVPESPDRFEPSLQQREKQGKSASKRIALFIFSKGAENQNFGTFTIVLSNL